MTRCSTACFTICCPTSPQQIVVVESACLQPYLCSKAWAKAMDLKNGGEG